MTELRITAISTKKQTQLVLLALISMVITLAALSDSLAAEKPVSTLSASQKLLQESNFKEALAGFRSQSLQQDTDLDAAELTQAFNGAIQCYQRLNQVHEIDAYRDEIAELHAQRWPVIYAVAASYQNVEHYGYLIAGEFRRGNHRGGGRGVHAQPRDRVRSLQLYQRAVGLVERADDNGKTQASAKARQLLDHYAQAILYLRGYRAAWNLQTLTDLDTLPDFEEGWGYHHAGTQGAPVLPDGTPVYYDAPTDWQSAKNDGERWRWVVALRTQWQPDLADQELIDRAEFVQSQFGVQTLANFGWHQQSDTDADAAKGRFTLETLAENETIARLATGVKRFELPAEHNHLTLRRKVLAMKSPSNNTRHAAWRSLAESFKNRRQFVKASELFEKYDPGSADHLQITANWGRLESTITQPAGRGATIDYRFRNGNQVEFTAHRIDVQALLTDVKAYIKGKPKRLEHQKLQIENLGYRLVREGQEKYVDQEIARWTVELEPAEGHFDRRETISTPLQKAGAYLLTAKMRNGNTHRVVVWISNTAIVKKPLENKALYYVADSVTGKPLANCNVEFFGFWNKHIKNNDYQILTKNFAENTGNDGFVELTSEQDNRRYQWLATATDDAGRFAFLGFNGVWNSNYHDQQYQQVKVFSITDRPVYRPGDKVQFKFWIRQAQYDQGDQDDQEQQSRFANQSFQIEIRDPKNEKVHTTTATADAYGGLTGEWQLPEETTLGQYQLTVVHHGGGYFRVEEYKKPEYEVTIDSPEIPLKLGDKITATINANYYFGAPVVEAKVKYKVLRTSYSHRWYPPSPWDWLYGRGYWWFSPEQTWYPGWGRWGCGRPAPWWIWQQPAQPEVIAEQEVEIGPEGHVEVEIDTTLAKELHPNQDHRYQITAEVVDQSRRAVFATGEVLVARKPFKVFLWTHRGFYRADETIEVDVAARTLADKAVEGTGKLRLLEITYEAIEGGGDKPVENEVASWELNTDEQGTAKIQITAAQPGQYRLAYELTDAEGNAIEGAQLLTIRGKNFASDDFHFNDLEIIPHRREYAAGDEVELQISTDQTGAAVLLFLRPSNGAYLAPQLVRIKGKSTTVKFPVSSKDMPNFFVEALTVHHGKLHTTVKEIFVPPVKRVLDIEVVPSAESYLPGQNAKLQLKITDEQGRAFVGSTVVAVYDKALDYIAGGSNVPEIREFFWKWRRNHRPHSETNLGRRGTPQHKNGEQAMRDLGVFGGSVADDDTKRDYDMMSLNFDDGSRVRRSRSKGQVLAVPMAATQGVAADEEMDAAGGAGFGGGGGAGGGADDTPLVEPTVRENFADTAFWLANLETNSDGLAEVEFDLPESLTTWKIGVWGMGHGTRVGQGSADIITRKNLLIRLQAPRFFVQKDEVVLSANVHNYLDTAKQVKVRLDLEGNCLTAPEQQEQTIEIAAGGEQRIDWRVSVAREGQATIRMSALTDEESDAMQMKFPVLVHGMLKTDSFTGVIKPDDSTGTFTVRVPAERRPEQSRLEIRYTPTLAGAMVDALPYLADYPHGCTEQTLNRFLPSVITRQTLRKMGVNLADIQKKRTNLNSQEIGDDQQRATRWQRFDRNPVFDEAELDRMVKAGVNKLTAMQLSDGGWGWFSGWGEHSSAHTTATVVRGLLIAKRNDVAIVPATLAKGVNWLEAYQTQQVTLLNNWDREAKKARDENQRYKTRADNLDALVYMVLAEAQREGLSKQRDATMRDYLYTDRTQLAVYSLATYGMALHIQQDKDKLQMVMQNLSQYVRQDDENQTAWLDMPGGNWWYWYGSEYEAQAYYLRLLVAHNPEDPVAPRMVKYLLNNRKHATYWNSTRDTALVVEAFADYLAATGEGKPDTTVQVWIDSKQHQEVAINSENLFTFNNKLVIEGEQLEAGEHTVEIRKTGDGPIYYNGYLTNFTLEDPIDAAGLEVKVKRRYYLLKPVEKTAQVAGGRGQVVNQKVEKYERTPIVNLQELASGDLIEVELIVDSKNDYEYLLLEDPKPAGCEALEVRSGYNGNEPSSNGLRAYVEYRDQYVGLFVKRLARGQHSVSYRLRAEIPGKFSALPSKISAMYAPELKGNSKEFKLRIAD